MQVGHIVRTCLVLLVCGSFVAGCHKKTEGAARINPHSADGVLLRLQDQARLFQEAYARKDYNYLHDWGYYFSGVLQAFNTTLNDSQRQRLRGTLDELARVSSQLDAASGRTHAGATEATVQRIQTLLQELEKQYRETKSGG